MGRRYNGASIVRALDALGAITGNLGVSGGGVSFYFKRRGAFETSFVRGEAAAPRTVCEPLFGPELLTISDPPIRALWITAGNPVAMLPQSHTVAEAIRTREFVVVVDSFLTDTAELADLVLPTTTLLEAEDVLGSYGHHYLGVARPVVPRPENVRSDLEIAQELARRVGLEQELAGTARQWQERLTNPKLAPHGVTLDAQRQSKPHLQLAACAAATYKGCSISAAAAVPLYRKVAVFAVGQGTFRTRGLDRTSRSCNGNFRRCASPSRVCRSSADSAHQARSEAAPGHRSDSQRRPPARWPVR
jgi:anaerobic selenocysteine-containing dehydrogenase